MNLTSCSRLTFWPIVIFICAIWFFVMISANWTQYIFGQVPMLDLDIYYQSAKDVLAGRDPSSFTYMQTAGPPVVILPYIPLSIFPLTLVRSAIFVLSILAIFYSAQLLATKYFSHHKLLATLLLSTAWMIAFPSRFNLGQGQPNLILMAIIAKLLFSPVSGKFHSLLLGLLILIKTNYLISFFSLKKSLLLKSVAVISLIIFLSLPIIKPQYYLDFLQFRAGATFFSSAPLADVDYYSQSLKSTLARFELNNWYLSIYFLLAFLLVRRMILSKDFRVGIISSLILSPILWQHYVVAIYPLIISFFAETKDRRRQLLLLLAMILISIDLPWLHGKALAFWPSLLASHYFFGLLLMLIAICLPLKRRTIG